MFTSRLLPINGHDTNKSWQKLVLLSRYKVAVYATIYLKITIKQTKASVLIYCGYAITLHVLKLTDHHQVESK
jgi:hypothetical protein